MGPTGAAPTATATRGRRPCSAHLGEGGYGHAVGPLLEGAGCLCGEGSGRRAVVRGREGQVVLVQEVACAAALPLLQAAGTRGWCLGPGQPRWHPARPGPPRLSPLKGARSCSRGRAGSRTDPVARCEVCPEGPGRLAGLRPTATLPPQPLGPSMAPAALLPLPRGRGDLGDSWEMPGASRAYSARRAWAQRGVWSPNPHGPQTGPAYAAPGGLQGSQTPPHRASPHPAPLSHTPRGQHGQGPESTGSPATPCAKRVRGHSERCPATDPHCHRSQS